MFKLHKHMWIYNKLIKELDQDMISHVIFIFNSF